MKWGRKILTSQSSESESRPSLISHVFPIPWLSKFKKKSSSNVETKLGKGKREGKRNSAIMGSPKRATDGGGRFYAGEGDDFWRLSFGEEDVEGKTAGNVLRSVWYDYDNRPEVQHSRCHSCGSNVPTLMGNEEIQKFNNLILDAGKMRELRREVEISQELSTRKSGHQAVIKTPRLKAEKGRTLRQLHQRISEDRWLKLQGNSNEAKQKSTKSVEKVELGFEPLRKVPILMGENCKLMSADLKQHHYVSSINSRSSHLTTIKEDDAFAAQGLNGSYGISAQKMSSEWENLRGMKIKELKTKNENQRKSLYISRELQRRRTKQSGKVKVSSPRIKPLEDMKKAKLKMKGKEKIMEGRTALDSFAVVKCSFDPQKDFRDSMIEMIMEKRICQPEELEELLACYLTLNSDEYHDLIIKVFRQVWIDLNQICFDSELQNEK
ncbi:hypothetical protein Dsin_020805 [Dipteronia sinensis]|uniref:Transcription repressor n=1 Tax=Dipteronia sinensis TaxID=43782 RepID=A0AAE0E5B2_9ROSI|nr:hypothetical protein Dsin_020805 [Dipteronia sinensis]